MRYSLRYFIPLALFAFAMVIGAISYVYNWQNALADLKEDTQASLRQQAVLLQGVFDHMLQHNEKDRLQTIVASLASDPNITAAVVVDPSNVVIGSLQRGDIGLELNQVIPRVSPDRLAMRAKRLSRIKETHIGEISLRPDEESMRAVFPLHMWSESEALRPIPVGIFYVVYDFSRLKLQVRRTFEMQFMEFAALLGFVALSLGLIFHYRITRRVSRLAQTSKRFASGDLDARTSITGRDELGMLGTTLNDTVVRVAQIQRALQRSEQRFRLLFDSAVDSIFVSQHSEENRAGTIVEINTAACGTLKYQRDELLGRSLLDVIPEKERTRIPWLNGKISPGEHFLYETLHITKLGEPIPVESNSHVILLEDIPVILTISRDIGERKRAEERLRRLEERFRKAFYVNPDAMSLATFPEGRFVEINEGFIRETGYSREELIGRTDTDFNIWTHPEDRGRLITILSEKSYVTNFDFTARVKNGEIKLALMSAAIIDIDEQPHILAVSKNITERKRMEEMLFEEKEKAQVTLQSIGDAVITTDQNARIEYMNPIAEQLTRWALNDVIGMPLDYVIEFINEDSRDRIENPVNRTLRTGFPSRVRDHPLLVGRDRHELPVDDSAAPIRDRDGNIIGAVMVFRDVSTARKMTYQLSWQASHDALTGLVNRREFETRVSRSIQGAWESSQHHALLYMDLDQFKIVNDTCGHIAGDELLKQLSALLQHHMRDTDTLARLGGDEFGVLLQNCPTEHALHIAEVIRDTVSSFRFIWEGNTFRIGVSVGLIGIDHESGPISTVMSAADMACYAAKEAGGSRVHVYREGDSRLIERHGEMQWVTRLNRAMEEKRLRLYQQAILPLRTNGRAEVCYEVLLRIYDEKNKLISPEIFLPAASRYGIMPALDRWVIHTVFEMQGPHYRAVWRFYEKIKGKCPFVHAINLSGATISDESVLDYIRSELIEFDIPPQVICFEITETEAVANLPAAVRFIADLKLLGCRFALDDFGRGVSSFTYLRNLPVDFLKIDGSFVKDMATDPINRAMVESIHNIGHVMGIQTIAESVEDDETLAVLREIGVDYAQGYRIGPPRLLTT